MDGWIRRCGILLSLKENGVLPFETTWVDLEGIMLSEISQRKKNTVCSHLHVESKKVKFRETEQSRAT